MMKAIVLSHYGKTDSLSLVEKAIPQPKEGEVLVKVHATSVNDFDWQIMCGKPFITRLVSGILKPNIDVLGTEIAGTVESVGPGVSSFAVGDRVFGDVSDAGFGGFAEYASVSQTALHNMPDLMTFQQAVSLPHASLLAWQGLVDLGNIKQGESVLINGAGGGVGVFALHIAKEFGCEVTGVDHALKLDFMKGLGFDHVIDYQKTDFTAEATRYDLILDVKTQHFPTRYLNVLNEAAATSPVVAIRRA
ncbi:NAD(P)-dependent alcohol dehydrogenase [Veronia pacifica]|uniref:NAD(P)-dependent alcohol dehydrogenase n=1 Tax=Veronia pacifica TaxID=1080227 RepID=UPI001C300374|nr:NAD(P)-dependent alcohol dehydrogenase [Veronia pacifica]